MKSRRSLNVNQCQCQIQCHSEPQLTVCNIEASPATLNNFTMCRTVPKDSVKTMRQFFWTIIADRFYEKLCSLHLKLLLSYRYHACIFSTLGFDSFSSMLVG